MGEGGLKEGLRTKLASEEANEFFDWLLWKAANQKIRSKVTELRESEPLVVELILTIEFETGGGNCEAVHFPERQQDRGGSFQKGTPEERPSDQFRGLPAGWVEREGLRRLQKWCLGEEELSKALECHAGMDQVDKSGMGDELWAAFWAGVGDDERYSVWNTNITVTEHTYLHSSPQRNDVACEISVWAGFLKARLALWAGFLKARLG